MYKITTRPLTDEQRERVKAHELQWRAELSSGLGFNIGCSVAYVLTMALVGFVAGGLLAALAAFITGNLDHAVTFVAWGGGAVAVAVALWIARDQIRSDLADRRERRAIEAGSYDFEDATVIRCEADAGAWCAHEELLGEVLCVLAVAPGDLLVLSGPYLQEARDQHGFPYSSFRLTVYSAELVLECRARGETLEIREIDYEACTEEERAALDEVPDQEVLQGSIETCVADITRQYRAWHG